MAKTDLDPFCIILGVIAQRQDSDLLLDVVSATGLRFDPSLSQQARYSNRTRVRELLPRIVAAYRGHRPDSMPIAAGVGGVV